MSLRFFIRLASLAALYVVLSEGRPGAWIVGVPTVLLALALSAWLPERRSWRVRPAAAVTLLPYFVGQSIRAGVDVAARALARKPRLDPALVTYRLRLEPGPARVFFMNTITVMPGTLSAHVHGCTLQVHLLDQTQNWTEELAVLERRVARLFGARLEEAREEESK
jgi:multicomponent Na+:H+ antiporter subunit E